MPKFLRVSACIRWRLGTDIDDNGDAVGEGEVVAELSLHHIEVLSRVSIGLSSVSTMVEWKAALASKVPESST